MSLEEIAAEFAAQLQALSPITDEEVEWPKLRLRLRTYIKVIELPLALVTSARAVIFRGSQVVVVRDTFGHAHVEPGGRIEPGETVEAALRRELREETGWSVGGLTPLGFHHFRPLGAPIANSRYRWGDFVQPLFVTEALAYDRTARDTTQIERGSRVTSISMARSFLETRQRLLLEAALAARGA